MTSPSRNPSPALLVLGALIASGPALSQEEVGKKGKKIAIDWAKIETKNYAIEYEKAIPRLRQGAQIGDELERVLEQYILVFKYKPTRSSR